MATGGGGRQIFTHKRDSSLAPGSWGDGQAMKSPKHFTDAPMLTLAMAAMIGIHSIRRHSQVYRHVSRCSSAVRFGGLGLAFQEVGLTARRGQKPSGMGRGGSRHASTLCCCNRSDFGIEGHLCTPKHKYCEHSIKVSAHNPLPPSLSLSLSLTGAITLNPFATG